MTRTPKNVNCCRIRAGSAMSRATRELSSTGSTAKRRAAGFMKSRFVVAATLVGASFVAAASQTPPPSAPPMKSILADKKVTPPLKGQADVDYLKPQTTRKGVIVVTKIQVKNASTPLSRA